MFSSVSMTATGAIIVILEQVAKLIGLDLPENTIGNMVDALVTLVGSVLLIWGQLRRKDLAGGIFRKKENIPVPLP